MFGDALDGVGSKPLAPSANGKSLSNAANFQIETPPPGTDQEARLNIRSRSAVQMIRLEDYYRDRMPSGAADLFAVFARFEFAMKEGGYRRKDRPDAAWVTFAADLPVDFISRMKAAPEAAIFFRAPPDHLVCKPEGGVGWSGAPVAATPVRDFYSRSNNLTNGTSRASAIRPSTLIETFRRPRST